MLSKRDLLKAAALIGAALPEIAQAQSFTCVDFEKTWGEIEKSPVNARWQEAMAPFFAPMAERKPGERFPMRQEVYYLD